MALKHYLWSLVAATNATADPAVDWQEGQAPSSINNSARAMMASAAAFRDDIAGALVTGGSSTAYTVASNQVFDSLDHMGNHVIAFSPHTTNGATVVLNVDGLGAKPLRSSPSVELQAGTLIEGTPYLALYNHSDQVFYLHGFYGNPYNVPLAAGMDYWAATTPNSSFAFPAGQAISRTTYAALFALIGTTYGAGDGSTTFNLPDKSGRVSAMKESSASRLTSAVSGVDGATMGSAAGSQSNTLQTANLPPYTPSGINSGGTATVPGGLNLAATGGTIGNLFPAGGGGNRAPDSNGAWSGVSSLQVSAVSFNGVAQGGTSTPLRTVQPTIICNYIMRII